MAESTQPPAGAAAQGADDQWYFTARGQRVGPVSMQAMREAASSGRLTASDVVWRPGMANWVPASQVPELGLPAGPPGGGGAWGGPPAAQTPVTLQMVIGIAICAAALGLTVLLAVGGLRTDDQTIGILCSILLLLLSLGSVGLSIWGLMLSSSRRLGAGLYATTALVICAVAFFWSIFLLVAVA